MPEATIDHDDTADDDHVFDNNHVFDHDDTADDDHVFDNDHHHEPADDDDATGHDVYDAADNHHDAGVGYDGHS